MSTYTVQRLQNANTNRVEQVSMLCDSPLDVDVPLPRNTFCWLIVGAPGSGKTNLLLNLINKNNRFYNKKFDRVYFVSPSVHTIGEQLGVHAKRLFSDLSKLDTILEINLEFKKANPGHRALLILDDMSHVFKRANNQKELIKLIQNRRHYGMSIMIVAQKINKIPLEVRALCDHLCMFNTPHSSEWKIVNEEFNPFQVSLNSLRPVIFKTPHDFLYMDLMGHKMYRNFEELIKIQ